MKTSSTKISVRSYSRIAGSLLLFSIIGGVFGEFLIPQKLIVSNNATETAINILESPQLFRLGFASYLIEAICDVSLIFVLYILLKPVNENIALLSVLFGVVSTITFACSELFYFMTISILEGNYLNSFSPEQKAELGYLTLKIYEKGAGIFMLFYGVASALRGYLMFKSGYFPKFLGILFMAAGTGFLVRNFLLVLAPAFATHFLVLPMPLAILILSIWFFVKGVDAGKWNAKQAKVFGIKQSSE